LSDPRPNCRRFRLRRLVRLPLLAATVLLGTGPLATLPYFPGQAQAAESTPAAAEDDAQRLVGRWIRTDGGYILELQTIGRDGTLDAGYYNPRPINVARAEWRRSGQELGVFIELRDVNYPGSTYPLHYDPETDRLQGIYFQAVAQERYAIEFIRSR